MTLATLLTIGLPVAAAPKAATTATPTPAPSASAGTDPLAGQITATLEQQSLLDQTKAILATDVQTAAAAQVQLHDLIIANQVAIEETLKKIAAAEQRFVDSAAKAQAQAAIADAAFIREHQDKQVLAVYLRQQYASHDDLVSYVLSGSSITVMLERAASATHTAESAHALVIQVQTDLDNAERAQAEAQADANDAAAATVQLQTQRESLITQTGNAQSLIYQLDAQQRAAAAEIAVIDGKNLALAQQVADLRIKELDDTIAKAEAADWTAAEFYIQNHIGNFPGLNGAPVNLTPGTGPAPLIWPAPGTDISQGFGPAPYVYEPSFNGYPHFHTGIDLAGSLGSPIYAAAGGVVVSASPGATGYGNHVIIAHNNGLLTLYGHMQTLLVHPGDQVTQGQLIGLLGSSGNSTGPHLHFEVRVNASPINPLPFLPPLPPGATGPPART